VAFVLPYRELPGAISARALEEHYKLYLGYGEMLGRVEKALVTAERPEKHLADSPFSGALWGQSYALGGVLLHELFFSSLTTSTNRIMLLLGIEAAIERKWGSQEAFLRDLRAVALSVRGWAVLALKDGTTDGLRIIGLDAHDLGAVFGYRPLLAIDVFEHAYWADHYTNRAAYLDQLLPYINWVAVEARYR